MNEALKVRQEINQGVFSLDADIEPLANIVDMVVPGGDRDTPIRVYYPDDDKNPPLLLYIHGAGWVAGGLDTHDNVCRVLAKRAGCAVISVGYRLSPEYHFPASLEDCDQALRWAAANASILGVDLERLSVAGDSAGGNLAAALCLMTRDQNGPQFGFQLLVNPALDLTHYHGEEFAQMRWFVEQYLAEGQDPSHPYVSPLHAQDLAGLPPAFILTGDQDSLCAEGETYGEKLRAHGVAVNVYRQRNRGHLGGHFARAANYAREAVDICAAVLRAAFKEMP